MSRNSSHHLRVLLRKDWLIMRRNWLFMIMFAILPIIMMSCFWYLHQIIGQTEHEEKHNLDQTRYGKVNPFEESFLGSNMSNSFKHALDFKANITAMGACKYGKRRDVGMIAPMNMTLGYEATLKKELTNFSKLRLHIFNTVEELFDDISTNKNNKYCFAFEMTQVIPQIDEVNITIFFPRDDIVGLINTYTPLYDLTQRNPDWISYNRTFLYGTPHFMICITDFILMMMRGHRMKELELAFIPMKTPAYIELTPGAAQNLSQAFPIFFMCIYLLPLYYLVTRLSEEKESKAREGMKMMGLSDLVYYKSWFVFNLLIVTMISFIIVGVLQIEVFMQSSRVLMLSMCIVYGTQLYGFSFSIVSILPSKKASATAASLMHMTTFYVVQLYKGYGSSKFEKTVVACLVPNVSLGFMLDHLLHVEIEGGSGLTLETASMPYQSFNFMLGLVCQLVCSFVWAMIGLYLDKVMPREFGKAEPWNFLCKSKRRTTIVNTSEEEIHDQKLVQISNFEKDADYLKRGECLRIRGLGKKFSNGFTAVHNESMTMYKGQIFALLGHNGAGKTTTISMLTGLIEPTEGSATIDGYNIFTDMEQLRDNLGVCPQHNVLFDSLTVREHLELFCALKGKTSEYEIIRRVDKMVRSVELDDVQFQLAGTLSGGQKRKLSVGIALIGDAKIVMLDEPTSGMDTTTRRRFWDMIKQYKEDRIIILTTHYMDEADVLGDRICIMAEGRVQCCGSSLFLKNRFGVGYNLTLTRTDSTKPADITKYIKTKLSEAINLQETSTELMWQLPESARSKFKVFFNSLDKDLQTLKLKSYGVSITTLEEVFLKIGHGQDDQKGTTIEQIKSRTADLSKLSPRERELTEYSISQDSQKSFLLEITVLIWKKLLVQTRDVRSCVMDIILPCLMIVVGIYVSKMEIIPTGHPTRNLSLYEFPRGAPFVHNLENVGQEWDEMEEFLDFGFSSDMGEDKLFSQEVVLDLNKTSHFFDQALVMSDYLYETKDEKGPYYAELFVQNANREDRQYSLAAFVNVSQPQAAMSAATYMLQSVIRSETENYNFKLNFFEAQLPFSMEWQVYIRTGVGLLSSLGFAVAYTMISDTLIQSLIKEKQMAIKHQIIISGGSKIAYWISNYIVDVITHGIPACLTCYSIQIFEVDAPDIENLFLWFCLTNPLFIYAVQFIFKYDGQASVFIRVFYFAFGGVAPIAMQILAIVNKDTIQVGDYLKQYFVLVPIYNINYGYISITNRHIIEAVDKLPKGSLLPLSWECAGEALYMLQVCAVLSFAILVIVENNLLTIGLRPMVKPVLTHLEMIHESTNRKKQRKAYNIKKASTMEDIDFQKKAYVERIFDHDPVEEEMRVKQIETTALKVENLTKSYTPFNKAVDNISFALDYGECFALLGITGAGKTTTFKCLCQEEIPDEGSLFMAGHNVRSTLGFASARQKIGYCPQFDAIYEHLTVREHLWFYATIKGVKRNLKTDLVTRQIRELDLVQYEHVHAGKLSGGNKRKLSCAMALIGNPPLVLLDEPSTGVDPQAKRFMWTVISNISTLRKQSTVILTTHSMEEAEALCPKMGIMVDGKFQCFGSAQHIKDKYADGFDIDLKIEDLTDAGIAKYILQLENENVTPDTFCNEIEAKDVLEKLEMGEVWDQNVTAENRLSKILRQESPYLLHEVLRWAHLEYQGLELVKKLSEIFGQCDVMEHFSNSFNLKVSRNNNSIGFVFGVMEELKSEFSVSEYSATQTTLEQIFNMFAKQKGVKSRHESLEGVSSAANARGKKDK